MRNVKKIIISILFILILPLYSLAQTGEIAVTVTIEHLVAALVQAPADKTADPGQTVIYNFTVQNVSNVSDAYNLSVESSQRWKPVITSGSTIGPLAPNESAQVVVQQTVPVGEPAGTIDTSTLTATSQTDRKVSGEDSVLTTVNQIAGIAVSIARDTQVGRPGDTITHRFSIKNTGNGPDGFTLTATSSLGWPITIVGGNHIGPLEPGGGVFVDLQISIPLTAADGDADILTFTAFSDFNPLISSSAQATTTVRIRGRR